MSEGIVCEVLESGHLLLRADDPTRVYLAEHRDRGDDTLLLEMLEHYWANGRYEPFSAGDANPFVGLTDAPCIAESLNTADDGTRTIEGRLWAFMNYQVESPVDTLITKGRVLFLEAK